MRIDLLLNVATATLEDKNCSPFSTSYASLLGILDTQVWLGANSCANVDVMGSFDEAGTATSAGETVVDKLSRASEVINFDQSPTI